MRRTEPALTEETAVGRESDHGSVNRVRISKPNILTQSVNLVFGSYNCGVVFLCFFFFFFVFFGKPAGLPEKYEKAEQSASS